MFDKDLPINAFCRELKRSCNEKILTVLILGLACSNVMAKPVKTEDQAVSMVIKSVQKNKLLSIPIECVFFMGDNSNSDFPYYSISVYEKHDEKCGGDPETTHRLMSYEIDKKTGKMRSDAMKLAERNGNVWDGSGKMYPIK